MVQPDTIFIGDPSLPIEEEDKFVRALPSGLEETYTVVDRGYYESFGGIPAHYQVKVEKESKEKREINKSIVYKVEGANSRININSHDSSTNVTIDSLNETNVFEKLRENIDHNLREEEKKNLMIQIDELERTKGTNEYTKAYKSFIQTAKDCMEIIAPFIPLISSFI